MELNRLGLRYERLLILTGPVTLSALLVLFVAVASDTQKDRVYARCYQSAADELRKDEKNLTSAWDKAKPPKLGYWGGDYKLKIQQAWIKGLSFGNGCYGIMDAETENRYRASPEDMIQKLHDDARRLSSTPLQLSGVEIPDKATINIVGTAITIDLMTFTQTLQIALGPLLLMWLCSLYQTRYRETRLIFHAPTVAQVFPHIINIYAVGHIRPWRKLSWLRFVFPGAVFFIFSLTRCMLLAILIIPPTFAYLYSLYKLHPDQYVFIFVIIGYLVGIAAFANLMLEFLPWHFKRIFPQYDEER